MKLIDWINDLSLGVRIICVALITMALVGTAGMAINFQSVSKLDEMAILQEKQLQNSLLKIIDFTGSQNLAMAKSIAIRPDVRQALATRDQKLLKEIMVPLQKEINKNTTSKVKIHFHIPPCTSFLRCWKPDKNGDDLSSFRATVKQVLQTGKPVVAIEPGRGGVPVRAVYPIFAPGQSDGTPVGSVEVFTTLRAIVKEFVSAFDDIDCVSLFTSSDVLNRDISGADFKEEGKYLRFFNWGRHKEFVEKLPGIEKILEKAYGEDLTMKIALRGGEEPLLLTKRLIGFGNRVDAVLLIIKSREIVDATITRQVIMYAAAVGVLLVLLTFVIGISNRYFVTGPLSKASYAFERLAAKKIDTPFEIRRTATPEMRKIGAYGDNILASIGSTIATMKSQSSLIKSGSAILDEVEEKIKDEAKNITEMADSMAEASHNASQNLLTVTESVTQLNTAAQEISDSVTGTVAMTEETAAEASEASKVINQLGDNVLEIDSVISVISAIAEQTNLLALNATIEAARAGEAGKGFAVVANEVKELAKQTASATSDITKTIETVQNGTKQAVKSMAGILERVNNVNDHINTIASAVEEQTAILAEVSNNIQGASTAVEELDGMAGQLAKQTRTFNDIVDDVILTNNVIQELSETIDLVTGSFQVDDSVLQSSIQRARSQIIIEAMKMKHITWRSHLLSDILSGRSPSVETDASKCDLGKWLASLEQERHILTQNPAFMKLVAVHRELHATVYNIKEAWEKGGKSEMFAVYKEKTAPLFEDIFRFLDALS